MPTSVLLAVLAAAGLLALAPALVRRYDATERLVAERAQSTARVLDRRRRRRTVPLPGRALYSAVPSAAVAVVVSAESSARDSETSAPPAEPAPVAEVDRQVWLKVDRGPAPARRATTPVAAAPRMAAARSTTYQSRSKSSPGTSPAKRKSSKAQSRRAVRVPQSPATYRRRRVLAGLILLNVIELIGVMAVSSGFWTGFAVTLLLLGAYLVHLRNSAIEGVRMRRAEARRAAVIAIEQAEIRMSNERRLAARREALRRAAAARATAQRDAQKLSQRYVDYDPERGARVRGKPYETGRGYDDRAAGF